MKINDFSKATCMLCGNIGLSFVNALRDDETHFAVECSTCGHVQITPLPTIEEDNEFYQKNEMTRRLQSKSMFDDRALMLKYEIWADEQVKILSKLIPNKTWKILEIGSGYGWLVAKMRKLGYEIDGIELSDEKREMFKQYLYQDDENPLLDINLSAQEMDDRYFEKYDVVFFAHVLEHITDPFIFLQHSKQMLRQGGKMIVIVPNFYDSKKEFCKEYNDFFYFRAHLSYFKPNTLKLLFQKSRFKDIVIEGTQLYSLENAIYWARNKKPFIEYSQIEMPAGLEWIGEYYKQTLEQQLISDGLLAIGTK